MGCVFVFGRNMATTQAIAKDNMPLPAFESTKTPLRSFGPHLLGYRGGVRAKTACLDAAFLPFAQNLKRTRQMGRLHTA